MKIEQLLINFRYRKAAISGITIILTILIIILLQTVSGYQSALKKAKAFQSSTQNTAVKPTGWEDEILKSLWKEKFWNENQISIAVADSMSLGIDLVDSIIHLNFKGLSLISLKIRAVYPENYLKDLSGEEYASLFGRPSMVINSKSNAKKRQFRKIKVNKEGDRQVLDSAAVNPNLLFWQFTLDNNLNFVIYGLPSETLSSNYPYFMDVVKNRISNIGVSLFKPYEPTIYIWISNKEAQSIFQALPDKPQMIMRN